MCVYSHFFIVLLPPVHRILGATALAVSITRMLHRLISWIWFETNWDRL